MYYDTYEFNSLPFIAAILPVWLAGMTEDLTKKVSPLKRLLAAFVSALIGMWLLNAKLVRLDVAWLDELITTYILVNALLIMIAVGGITHAMNIIDGFNGLAGGVVVMILSALAYVSYQVNDLFLFAQCLALIGATMGFLFWNYPRGSIFAGDGGAYLWGFMVAEICVMLVYRNPQVSPWFPLLLVIYPVWETVFSIYRRKVIRGLPAGLPDAIHLHSLVYKRLVRHMIGSKEAEHMIKRNSLTAPYLWCLAAFSIVPAVLCWSSTPLVLLFTGLFILCYCGLYAMIVRFKIKRWMTAGGGLKPAAAAAKKTNS
ncbi:MULTISPECIES: glycosyltransferase [unclassified Undibacterium]|uniref:MraY family glycosyltransferase n=1 Tax=unclassified Undibacterium TaxID=2630295 RepID=UPI002AC89F77|nr:MULTISPECIES: glycosyltransferase [unclassified Undibacterium]MEB0140849.1 glycosyltransferase [Undibacterium sp. CCC2.1]MEB0173806.1 glycosyltransferase [Undibacterium sp. CCC1.1]MEB0177790.1 glycosyltransferase [Undibacterium sp. CCC3.4]MEB0217349.1 glycosyltransferase [Undibacterium sp. 5I2]WPX42161.1 glycosyltransferase [Undibacterium sp. CCC3.4]